MADVVSLSGEPIAPSGGVSTQCVEELERLLRMAKDGEIKGFACTAVHSDNSGSYTISGFVGGYSMVGACEVMKSELMAIVEGYE